MNINDIQLGDHVREPRMAGQAGIVVAKNSIKGIGVLHCYDRGGACVDIVFSDTLVVMKKHQVERLQRKTINVDELKQELIENGELKCLKSNT